MSERFRIFRCPSGSCAADGGPWHLDHPSGPSFGGVYPTWPDAVEAFQEALDTIRRQRSWLAAADHYRATVRRGL